MSYDNPRIKLNMSFKDILVEMAEGNPGALTVMMQMMERAEEIDPDSVLGAIGPLCGLDTLDCYGPKIWMLYKDVCNEDIIKVFAVLRAHQLGFISDTVINAAISNSRRLGDSEKLNVDDCLKRVRKQLPMFAAKAKGAAA